MRYSTRQMLNRSRANRAYRSRRKAQGWKLVQWLLPGSVAAEVLLFKEKQVAEYKARSFAAETA
jgi:hypothetical protein